MSDGAAVLDASALLALLQGGPGADVVAEVLPRSSMSAVNLSEVVAKLADHGVPEHAVHAALDELPIDLHPFDRDAAYSAGGLRRITRRAGLSPGDRACLALAMRLGVAAVTVDRASASIEDDTTRITVIR